MDKTFKVRSSVEIEIEDIVDGLDRRQLFDLIVAIDERMAEWDFTLKLCDHFDQQRKQYEAEVADDEGCKCAGGAFGGHDPDCRLRLL